MTTQTESGRDESHRQSSDAARRQARTRRTAYIALALLAAFLLGFLPQWFRVRSLDRQLTETRYEYALLDLNGRVGAALAEAQRGNYERARQLMTGFFSGIQLRVEEVREPGQREELLAILQQRDELITLLSRAEPEATSRLNLIYTRFFAAVHPLGREAPTSLTPSPPP